MATRTAYRGLHVVDGATGQGGQDLTQNFEDLADWSPKSVWDNSTVPTPDDDETQDFYPGSLWLNTDTNKLYICRDSTATMAKWQLVPYLISGATGSQVNASPKLSDDLIALSSYCPHSRDATRRRRSRSGQSDRIYRHSRAGGNPAREDVPDLPS